MSNIKKNFAYQAIWQVLSMLLPLVTSPLLARNLGAEGIGIYSFTSSVVGYFTLVANFGVYRHGLQQISKARNDTEERNRIFWEIWWLHMLISIVVGCFYVIFIVNSINYKLFYVILGLQYLGGILSIDWLFAGLENFKKITIRDTIIKLVTFCLILLFIRDQNDLLAYIVIMAGGSFAGGIVFWISAHRCIHFVPISIKKIFSHSKGMTLLFIPVLVENIYTSMDKIMLGIMDSKVSVGFYENAEKALISQRIIHALIAVIMPRMSFLIYNHKKEEINQLMEKIIESTMLLSVVFAIVTAAVSKDFSVIFWGEEFYPCARLIFIMALAMPAMGLSRLIRDEWMLPSNQNKSYILCAGLGALTNFLINLFLVPYFGVIIAAVSTFISECVVFLSQCIVVRNQIPIIHYIKEGGGYIIFGMITFLIIRGTANFLGLHIYALLIEVAVGILSYTVMCSLYWKMSDRRYYFDLMKSICHRLIKK